MTPCNLAPFAANDENSRGRKFSEEKHPYRSEYQRDRERIIHSKAFRRLEYKTQVFINHEGDHYRTRLTHSLEVAQIARSISRALNINEDLVESIALAHDLGHTPFGHAGEAILNTLLKDHGGFEHNKQSLRTVEFLEKKYHAFDGLNLTWETREGLIKHSSSYDHPDADAKGYLPDESPSLEAQSIDLADEIAYNNHDLDDGLSSGILKLEEVKNLSIWKLAEKKTDLSGITNEKIIASETIRSIINILVSDLIDYTKSMLIKHKIKDYNDIRKTNVNMTGLSPEILKANNELKKFLREKLYKNYKVERMTFKAQGIIKDLFHIYSKYPEILPDSFRNRTDKDGIILTVTDYIAGMTDRYAIKEHHKLINPQLGDSTW